MEEDGFLDIDKRRHQAHWTCKYEAGRVAPYGSSIRHDEAAVTVIVLARSGQVRSGMYLSTS